MKKITTPGTQHPAGKSNINDLHNLTIYAFSVICTEICELNNMYIQLHILGFSIESPHPILVNIFSSPSITDFVGLDHLPLELLVLAAISSMVSLFAEVFLVFQGL